MLNIGWVKNTRLLWNKWIKNTKNFKYVKYIMPQIFRYPGGKAKAIKFIKPFWEGIAHDEYLSLIHI